MPSAFSRQPSTHMKYMKHMKHMEHNMYCILMHHAQSAYSSLVIEEQGGVIEIPFVGWMTSERNGDCLLVSGAVQSHY